MVYLFTDSKVTFLWFTRYCHLFFSMPLIDLLLVSHLSPIILSDRNWPNAKQS